MPQKRLSLFLMYCVRVPAFASLALAAATVILTNSSLHAIVRVHAPAVASCFLIGVFLLIAMRRFWVKRLSRSVSIAAWSASCFVLSGESDLWSVWTIVIGAILGAFVFLAPRALRYPLTAAVQVSSMMLVLSSVHGVNISVDFGAPKTSWALHLMVGSVIVAFVFSLMPRAQTKATGSND